jgi:hypothetical protein
MQKGHVAWACTMGMKHGLAAWNATRTCSINMQ